jgi:DNA-binding NarL/FixJ family response regulator
MEHAMTSPSVEYARTSATALAAGIVVLPKRLASLDVWTRKAEDVLRLKAKGMSADRIAAEVGVSRASVLRVFRFVERASAG